MNANKKNRHSIVGVNEAEMYSNDMRKLALSKKRSVSAFAWVSIVETCPTPPLENENS